MPLIALIVILHAKLAILTQRNALLVKHLLVL